MTQYLKPVDLPPSRLDARDARYAAVLFLLCVLVYNWNEDVSYNPDVLPHAQLARSVYRDGDVVTSAKETPASFLWRLKEGSTVFPIMVEALDENILSLREQGSLYVERYCYFFSPSIREGEYISLWGPGVPILCAPFFWAWETFVRDMDEYPGDLWRLGKFVATLFVAASAAAVYLTSVGFVPRWQALLVAMTYAFATSVWSISSQNLWQHSAMELFLALGAFSLCRFRDVACGVASGVCFAIATWCRPTGALFVIAVAVYFLLSNRRSLWAFCLAGLPFAVVLMWYNSRHFGSPFTFGQSQVDHPEVIAISGKGDLWQTPLWYGLLGHLTSPSRGLFVFSPVLLFSVWGAMRVWRDRRFVPLRPLSISVCLLLCLQARFVDWWSGFSYGYRHIVDVTPAMALFLVPVVGSISSSWKLRIPFLLCLAWSVFVQILGVSLYDTFGWNARSGLVVRSTEEGSERIEAGLDRFPQWILDERAKVEPTLLSIDNERFRYRLWRLRDSQIVYYATHPARARHVRNTLTAVATRNRWTLLADTHRRLGDACLALGRRDQAIEQYSLALKNNASDVGAALGKWLADGSESIETLHEILSRCIRAGDISQHNRLAVVLAARRPSEALLLLDAAAEAAPLESLFEPPDIDLAPPWLDAVLTGAREETRNRFRVVFEAAMLLNCGWHEWKRGRPELAARIFQQLVELDPEQAIAQLRWGQSLQDAGKWAASIAPISRSLELGLRGPWRREALQALARAQDGRHGARWELDTNGGVHH